jgi:AraC-like DNA-binding protein
VTVSRSYVELAPPPGLETFLTCGWVSHDGEVRVLPDACVDIVFEGDRLVVAGPATEAAVAPATPGRRRVGVRFRIGAAGAALGAPAIELLDDQVSLSELWGRDARRLEDRVAAAPHPAAALAVLAQGVAQRLPPPNAADADVRRAALVITRGGGVTAAGRAAYLSERQLRRRFEHAVGYGPATLARVTRFQRFLTLARATPAPLARLAIDAGYADQAHLTRECRRLAGLPPAALLAAGAAPAGEPAIFSPRAKADPFKPTRASSGRLAA